MNRKLKEKYEEKHRDQTRHAKRDGAPRKVCHTRRNMTDEQVMAMRRGERYYRDVAAEAGVSRIAAWFALRGFSYKELPL